MPTWTYKGRLVTEINDMPEGTYGFIYETTHKSSGKKYIGKKVLFFERNKRLGKRALEALREERKAKGLKGREWCLSEEAGFYSAKQGERVIEAFDELFEKWKPRADYELINTSEVKGKYLNHKITY